MNHAIHQGKKLMTLPRIFFSSWLALLMPVTFATAAEFAPTQSELATLPPYCAARLNEQSAAFKSWQSTMGAGFLHIHHYCFGLNFMNRARGMSSSNKEREGTLQAAITNFNYVLRNTQPDFYMRPEVLMNRGITLSMQHNDGAAVGDLLKAIEMDPGLSRAYMALADLYVKQKNRSKALDTVTTGLRHSPETKSLQRRYTELGGHLPYPEPIQPAVVESATEKPEPSSVPADAIQDGSEPPATSLATAPAEVPAGEPVTEPKIGSPNNPYCRFCPD
jgi:tetratricopeptide (TPR) repeat protein